MLASLPVVRSSYARALFISTVLVTAAILYWTRGFAATRGATHLATVFVYLFTALDYPATVCALLIVGPAIFIAERLSLRGWFYFAVTGAITSIAFGVFVPGSAGGFVFNPGFLGFLATAGSAAADSATSGSATS